MTLNHEQHDLELLSAFRDGVLGERDRQRALAQLQTCQECQALWYEWEAQSATLKQMRMERAPLQLRQMVFEVSRRPDFQPRQSIWKGAGEGIALAAAGVAVVVVLGSVFQSRMNGMTETASAGPRASAPASAPAPAAANPVITGVPSTPSQYHTPTPLPAGTNWSALGPRQSAFGLGVVAGEQAEIVAALGGKIYTGRAGANRSLQLQPSNGLNTTRVDAIVQPTTSPSLLIAASSGDYLRGKDPGGLFLSRDGGQNWLKLRDGFAFSAASDPVSRLVVVGRQGNLLRSTDGGENWSEVNLRQFGDYAITSVLITRQAGPVIYAGGSASTGSEGILLRSTDGGRTWQKVDWPGLLWVTDLVASADGSAIYTAGGDGIYQTTDGGRTWSTVKPPPGGAVGAVAVDRIDTRVLYAATKTGVYASNHPDTGWESVGALDGAAVRRIVVTPGDNGSSVVVATDQGLYSFPRAGVRAGAQPQ